MIYDKEYDEIIKNKSKEYWDKNNILSNEIFVKTYLPKIEKDIGIKIFCLWLYEVYDDEGYCLSLDKKSIDFTLKDKI